MMNFIRSLCITISSAFLTLIPKLYAMFYNFAAEPTFFDTENINTLTNNMYSLVSAVMLFALASKALATIVNPDNIWDGKKGFAGVIKRSVIALVLLVGIPFGFKYFYEFQTEIISKGLIEKIILGIDFEDNVTDQDYERAVEEVVKSSDSKITIDDLIKVVDPKGEKGIHAGTFEQLYEQLDYFEKLKVKNFILDEAKMSAKWQIGEVLASEILYDTLRPNSDDGSCDSGTGIGIHPATLLVNVTLYSNPITSWAKALYDIYKGNTFSNIAGYEVTDNASICGYYVKAVNEDIEYVTYLVDGINATTSAAGPSMAGQGFSTDTEKYVFQFDYWGLLCLAVSGAVVYMLILFCIDSALRLIKLGFLEITAPVSIMAYIYGGSEYLKKWFNEVLSTVIGFFLRVAAISFLALVLSNLDSFTSSIPKTYNFIARIFLLIGALIFAKKVPEIIEKLTGAKLNLSGGLGGRLGQMAGVGKVAQNAFKSLGNTVKGIGSTAVGLGLGAAGLGAAAGAKAADNKFLGGRGQDLLNKLKNTKGVKGAMAAGSVLKSGVQSGGGVMKSMSAMNKTRKDNEFLKNISANKQQEAAETWRDKYSVKNSDPNDLTDQYDQYDRNRKLREDPNLKINDSDSNSDKAKKQLDRINEARRAKKSREDYRNTITASNKTKEAGEKYSQALRNQETVEELQNLDDKINNSLEAAKNNTKDTNVIRKINELQKARKEKNISDRDLINEISNLSLNNGPMIESEANDAIKNINAFASLSMDADIKSTLNNLGIDADAKLTATALGIAKGNAEGNVTLAKNDYDNEKKKDGMLTDSLRAELDNTIEKREKQRYKDEMTEMKNSILNGLTYNDTTGAFENPYQNNPNYVDNNIRNTQDFVGPMPQNTSTSDTQTQTQNSNNNQPNNVPNMNGGTIHVDNIQANNINANTVNGQNLNANNIPDGFTRTDSDIVIPNQPDDWRPSDPYSNNSQSSSNSDEREPIVLDDERLVKEMQRIERRIRELNSKGSFMTSDDRKELEELHREMYDKSAQQYKNNSGPSDDNQ